MRLDRGGGIPLEARRATQIEFVGEQDGPSERDLKSALGPILASHGVKKAYLARVRVGEPEESGVALCLVRGNRLKVVDEVGAVFRELFGARYYLDILFLNKQQQAEIVGVCRSFFEAA